MLVRWRRRQWPDAAAAAVRHINATTSKQFLVVAASLLAMLVDASSALTFTPWSYTCDEFNRCLKTDLVSELADPSSALGLQECKLVCEPDSLFWPKPKSVVYGDGDDRTVTTVDPAGFRWTNRAYYASVEESDLIQRNLDEQAEWIIARKPKAVGGVRDTGRSVDFEFYLSASSRGPRITKNTNEAYSLNVTLEDSRVTVKITSENYFGARHAVETLFKVIDYDDVRENYIMLANFYVEDEPEFSHRGISLDTSRNFMTVEVIKRLIDGLASTKLNVLHWHMVDTQSFPIELLGEKTAIMTQYGAYDASSIYTQADMKDIITYANFRGVRVIPEFDQPAHVGVGWDFPGAENYTVCVEREPWYEWCLQPPCGQLNPAEPAIYDQLEAIYSELYSVFQFDTFHMGADEVYMPCWNSSQAILDYIEAQGWEAGSTDGFIRLWKEFQDESSARLKAVAGDDVDIVVWTSDLTLEENLANLPNDDYIVQIWTNGSDTKDATISGLVENKYRMVFSNVDSLYLDCGYGAWVGEGNNWCSPYKGWQKIYSNDLYNLLEIRGFDTSDEDVRDLVLGGEVCMWAEQTDTETVEGKVFPRAAALGERLWSNPSTKWYEAETRMLEERKRVVERGVRADAIQPEWCRQNGDMCYVVADNPTRPPDQDTTTTTSTTDDGAGGSPEPSGAAAAASSATAALVLSFMLFLRL